MEDRYYFAYGSNMNLEQMKYRCPAAEVVENVRLEDYRLAFRGSVTNGNIQIYGGDTFYLSADLLLTGSYASGSLYGSVGKTWRTLVLTTGDSKQDIGVLKAKQQLR